MNVILTTEESKKKTLEIFSHLFSQIKKENFRREIEKKEH